MSKQVAIVTGASRGIGRATALLLAKNNYKVCVNYQANQSAAQELVNEIRQLGGEAIAIAADVANEAQIIKMFEQVDQKLGKVTALVNNAGIILPKASLLELSTARLNQIFQTNVIGTILCSREAVKRMSTHLGGKGGAIVNLSSRAAILGSPNEYIDYAASKGAIETLTTGLALEVASAGIRVNAVRPGLIYTDIHAAAGEPGRVDRVKANIPMQRGGTPEEVAEAIYWLISDKSSFTTGTFIDISGGR